MNRIFTLSLFCLLTHLTTAQELNKAAKIHFIDSHFQYTPQTIQQAKIKSLEKLIYNGFGDSSKGIVEEYHQFNPFGKPIFITTKFRDQDKIAIRFNYDSSNRLIKKAILKRSKSTSNQFQEKDVYSWKYDNNKISHMQRSYMPTEDDSSNYPAKYWTSIEDSLAYNYSDSSVVLYSDRNSPSKKDNFSYYTSLKFHPNNIIKESISQRDTRINLNHFDSCGTEVLHPQNELIDILYHQYNFKGCLPQQLKNTHYQSVDSINIDHEGVKTLYLMPNYNQSSASSLKIDPNKHIITLKVNGAGTTSYDHIGPIYYYYDEVSIYNLNLKIVSSETYSYTSRSSGRLISDLSMQLSELENQEPIKIINPQFATHMLYRKSTYTYYPNGLLKSVRTVDDKNVMTNKVLYTLTHY